jgi:hypothetical protein
MVITSILSNIRNSLHSARIGDPQSHMQALKRRIVVVGDEGSGTSILTTYQELARMGSDQRLPASSATRRQCTYHCSGPK